MQTSQPLNLPHHIGRGLFALASTLALSLATAASDNTATDLGPEKTQEKSVEMVQVRDLYPLITAPDIGQVRDFYVDTFGFTVAFEASWFVYLVGPADGDTRGATLAFMTPDHPSSPPGPESFNGTGMILTLEVADASSVYELLSAKPIEIIHPLTDEAWGQRRFMLKDPAGVLIDIVEQIAPKEGYWDQYMTGQ